MKVTIIFIYIKNQELQIISKNCITIRENEIKVSNRFYNKRKTSKERDLIDRFLIYRKLFVH